MIGFGTSGTSLGWENCFSGGLVMPDVDDDLNLNLFIKLIYAVKFI